MRGRLERIVRRDGCREAQRAALLPKTEANETERAPKHVRVAESGQPMQLNYGNTETKPSVSAHHSASEQERGDALSESIATEADE
jgi:hypothetical protein